MNCSCKQGFSFIPTSPPEANTTTTDDVPTEPQQPTNRHNVETRLFAKQGKMKFTVFIGDETLASNERWKHLLEQELSMIIQEGDIQEALTADFLPINLRRMIGHKRQPLTAPKPCSSLSRVWSLPVLGAAL